MQLSRTIGLANIAGRSTQLSRTIGLANIRQALNRITAMKKITLSAEARARIARQIAENSGVAVVCGDQQAVLRASDRDHFRV